MRARHAGASTLRWSEHIARERARCVGPGRNPKDKLVPFKSLLWDIPASWPQCAAAFNADVFEWTVCERTRLSKHQSHAITLNKSSKVSRVQSSAKPGAEICEDFAMCSETTRVSEQHVKLEATTSRQHCTVNPLKNTNLHNYSLDPWGKGFKLTLQALSGIGIMQNAQKEASIY